MWKVRCSEKKVGQEWTTQIHRIFIVDSSTCVTRSPRHRLSIITPVSGFITPVFKHFPQPSRIMHHVSTRLVYFEHIRMAMAAEKISTKLFIQHPIAPDCKLIGILEQLSPGQSTHGTCSLIIQRAYLRSLDSRNNGVRILHLRVFVKETTTYLNWAIKFTFRHRLFIF